MSRSMALYLCSNVCFSRGGKDTKNFEIIELFRSAFLCPKEKKIGLLVYFEEKNADRNVLFLGNTVFRKAHEAGIRI